jgi:hypothetical protein
MGLDDGAAGGKRRAAGRRRGVDVPLRAHTDYVAEGVIGVNTGLSVRMGHRQKPTRGQLSTILVDKSVENSAPSFKAP